MNNNQIMEKQIALMEELLFQTKKTNELITDLIGETMESNSLVEDVLMEAFGLDNDDFEDEEDFGYGYENDDFEFDIDFEDEEDEEFNAEFGLLSGCGDVNCTFCNPKAPKVKVELTREQIEEKAYEDLVRVTSTKQLPYTFFGSEFHEYTPDKANPIELSISPEDGVVVAMMKNALGKVTHRGIARCLPHDKFSANIGAVIAVHRLFNLEVPAIYVK